MSCHSHFSPTRRKLSQNEKGDWLDAARLVGQSVITDKEKVDAYEVHIEDMN